MTDRELVARIAASAGRKAGYKQLVRELGLGGGRERRLLLEQLARLTVRGQLVQLDREHWSLPKATSRPSSAPVRMRPAISSPAASICTATATASSAPIAESGAPGTAETEDIFIPPNEINCAMQGDQVLVEVEPPKADGRMQGRILRILERRNPTVVGTFHYADPGRGYRQNVVIPFDERMTQPIVIPPGAEIPPAAASSTPHPRVSARATLVQNPKARSSTAWSSTSKSPVGPRPRVRPSAA